MKESIPSLIYTHFGLSDGSGKKEFHIRFGWTILSYARDIANRNNVSMRELDRALWKYSADYGKKGLPR